MGVVRRRAYAQRGRAAGSVAERRGVVIARGAATELLLDFVAAGAKTR